MDEYFPWADACFQKSLLFVRPRSRGRKYLDSFRFYPDAFAPTAGRRATTAALTATGLRSTVSSRYLSAATACAVGVPSRYPSAPMTSASFLPKGVGFFRNPLLRRFAK